MLPNGRLQGKTSKQSPIMDGRRQVHICIIPLTIHWIFFLFTQPPSQSTTQITIMYIRMYNIANNDVGKMSKQ
jgi:hypothetical protein